MNIFDTDTSTQISLNINSANGNFQEDTRKRNMDKTS